MPGSEGWVRLADLDDMIEYALRELLSGSDQQRRELVRRMCHRWPQAPALSVVFALTSTAAMIDDNLTPETNAKAVAPLAYKMAAVLAADVFAAEQVLGRPAKAHDLLHFWRRVDPYFMQV